MNNTLDYFKPIKNSKTHEQNSTSEYFNEIK